MSPWEKCQLPLLLETPKINYTLCCLTTSLFTFHSNYSSRIVLSSLSISLLKLGFVQSSQYSLWQGVASLEIQLIQAQKYTIIPSNLLSFLKLIKSFPAGGLHPWHNEFWIGVPHFLIILEQLTQRFINIRLATFVLSSHNHHLTRRLKYHGPFLLCQLLSKDQPRHHLLGRVLPHQQLWS